MATNTNPGTGKKSYIVGTQPLDPKNYEEVEIQEIVISPIARIHYTPCCGLRLRDSVMFVASLEIFVHLIALSFYIYYYMYLQSPNSSSYIEESHHYRTIIGGGTSAEIVEFLSIITILEITACALFIFLSCLLIIAALKRNRALCYLWICANILLQITRLTLAILAPVGPFLYGLLWIIMEIYYITIVVLFIDDIKTNPKGEEDGVPYYEEIYPITGYQFVQYAQVRPVRSRKVQSNTVA